MAVGVEDTVAKKVAEGTVEGGALVVDGEVGLEYVLDHGGVGGEDLAGAEGAVEDEGGGGGAVEDVGDPMDAAVVVGCDGEHGTDYGVCIGNGGCSGG